MSQFFQQSDLEDETKEDEKNNERCRTQLGWCMNQGVYKTKSVDDTKRVSVSNSEERDSEEYDKDRLPECITKLFMDDETSSNINANDE